MKTILRSLFLSCLALPVATQALAEARGFEIEAGAATRTLQQFAQQAGLELVYSYDVVQGVITRAVSGRYEPHEALAAMLKDTSLEYASINDSMLAIRAKSSAHDDGDFKTTATTPGDSGVIKLAQADQAQTPANAAPGEGEPTSLGEAILDEVVVTGTHIRGAAPVGSPTMVYSREDIERSGVTTIDQFIERLPQNFAGGQSQDTIQSIASEARDNSGLGSGIDIRGLGAGTTLVLLNGHRLAPASGGSFFDVSMIPVNAIERMEILTDGASAIYGADAVGGVVNFVLRKDYEGLSTAVRYGTDSGSDLSEWRASQDFGTQWDGGGVLAAYEFHQRDPLRAGDRDFSQGALNLRTGEPFPRYSVLPKQDRHSLFLSAHQDVDSRLQLLADFLYSKRDSFLTLLDGGFTQPETQEMFGSLSGEYVLGADWRLQLTGSYGDTDVRTSNSQFDSFVTNQFQRTHGHSANRSSSVETLLNGSFAALPGGPVRVAFGGSYRDENRLLQATSDSTPGVPEPQPQHYHRAAAAVFGELLIPLVGAANKVRGIERLELSLAGRYDHYSDFGDSTIPRVGLSYAPNGSFTLRGTFGRSYRAPLLQNLIEQPFLFLAELPDPQAVDLITLALLSIGEGNTSLDAETARTWTAGIDWRPAELPMTVSFTWYDIDFDDRIVRPAENFFEILLNEAALGSLIQRNPGGAFIQDQLDQIDLLDPTQFFNAFGPFAPSDVLAFADDRISNIAAQKQRGLDLLLRANVDTSHGRFDFDFSANYIVEYTRALTPTSPALDVVNRYEAPIDFHARGQAGWSRGGLSAAAAVNYADGYTNTIVIPEVPIGSWTTVDVNLGYSFDARSSEAFLAGTSVTLSVLNLFDEDPPIAAGAFDNRGYDPANADPLGRFIAVQAAKRW